jgi:membrane protein YdbS with pleckstrin-like domain
MGFPTKHLNDNEQIILEVHPHWWYLTGPLAATFVSFVGAIAILFWNWHWAIPVAVVLLASLAWLVRRYFRWRTTTFTLTTQRLIHRSGVFGRSSREIPLDHLTDVSYHQTFLDRLIGAGDLSLESAGRDSRETFPDLPRPAQLQNFIYRQIEAGKTRSASPPMAPPPLQASVPDQIDQLDELRRRGVLSQAEFEAKKADLLDRM